MGSTITDAQSCTTTYQYDARGNRTAVIDPINGSAHPTTFTYDIMNHLTGITYPDGGFVSFGYDYRGRRTSVTDQNGKITTYTYDDADRLTAVTDPASHSTQYIYDTENNLVSITDANGHVTSFGYDAYGRVTQTAFPSGLAESYAYDAVDQNRGQTGRSPGFSEENGGTSRLSPVSSSQFPPQFPHKDFAAVYDGSTSSFRAGPPCIRQPSRTPLVDNAQSPYTARPLRYFLDQCIC